MKNMHEGHVHTEEKPELKKRHHDLSESPFGDPLIKDIASTVEETQASETIDETLARIDKEAKAREAKKQKTEALQK